MALMKLSVRDFRCFTKYSLDLHPQRTVVSGANGSGKTSLLEAIYSASSLRSFRTPAMRELIAHGAEAFSIKATTTMDDIHIAYGRQARVVEVNGKPLASRVALMTCMPVVAVTEQDMELIQGPPLMRRAFLDYTAAQRRPGYVEQLKKLSEIVSQRNALLGNEARWNQTLYQIATEQLVAITADIRAERMRQLQELEIELHLLFRQVLGGGSHRLQLLYKRGGGA